MIKLTISHKLFGAFFLILAVIVGALIFSRYLFTANFHNYINQLEMEKLDLLVPVLQQEYQSAGDWQRVRVTPEHWETTLHDIADIRQNPPPDPGHRQNRELRVSRLLLSDERLQPIIGVPEANDRLQLVPIEVDGTVVGWLGLKERRPFRSGPPAVLLERQARQLTLLGGGIVIVTVLVVVVLSRHLIKPIRHLTDGTRALAERNFAVRIKPGSGDELGQLAEHFNSMAETLERSETMRRQWLADISHELRTPLAVLRGEIESLQDGIRAPTPDNLASLHTEILRLGKLVEDLHQLSLAESGALAINRDRIEPAAILAATADGFQSLFDQHDITVQFDLPGLFTHSMTGDGDRLAQVFRNIFENICRHVRTPGHVQVTGRINGSQLELCFADSGPGVPAEALPRLFDRLYRVESSRSRAGGGSGLGLAICKQIITEHGGTIHAEPSSRGGLAIVVILPLTA